MNKQTTFLRKSYRKTTLLFVPLLLPTLIGSTLSHASETVEAEPSLTLDTITVTARLVAESKQSIPFTINVISGEETERAHQVTLEDTLQESVGVDIISNMGASKSLRMRGVGALQSVSGDDNSVVISIDGLPQSVGSATLTLMDIQQIEILKGPQGTLFGRNSEAGAINITTNKPTAYFESGMRFESGNKGQLLADGFISGPFSDTLSGRLALHIDEADTVVKNSTTKKPISTMRNKLVRGSLLWQPQENTSVLFSTGLEEAAGKDTMYVMRPYPANFEIDIPPGSNKFDHHIERYLLKIEHQLPMMRFTALSGYAHTTQKNSSPIYEGNLYDYLAGVRPESNWAYMHKENLFNQELRLASLEEAKLFWVTGINYYTSQRYKKTHDVYDPFNPSNPLNATINRKFTTDSLALFGEITYPIIENLKMTTGLRQSWEKKRYHANWRANNNNPSSNRFAVDNQKLNDHYTTGRFALSYEFTERSNLYAIYSRGYKIGGFNDEGTDFSTGIPDQRYNAARVNSVEVGLKTENLSGTLGTNIALFHNGTKSEHLLAYNPNTFVAVVENYDTRSQGIELEGFWHPTSSLKLSAGVGYTKAKIVGIPRQGNAHVRHGNKVPDTPTWNGNVTLNHRLELPSFWRLTSPGIESKISNRYIGSRPANPQNTITLKSYNKVDARIALAFDSSEIYLWGDNVLNKKYDLWGYYMPAMDDNGPDATIGSPGRGRTFGVGLAHYF